MHSVFYTQYPGQAALNCLDDKHVVEKAWC